MNAQDIYDIREQFETFSGTDLHALFAHLVGEPSPAGRTPIDVARLREIAETSHEWMYSGDPTHAARCVLAIGEVEYEDERGAVEVRRFVR